MATPYIEGYIPVVNDFGFNTNKAATFGSTVAITGALSLTGNLIGRRIPVTASGGATRTLTAANSGSVNLFDSAAGITYTLPAPVVGLYFDFLWTILQTSSAHVVVTDAGTTFLTGWLTMFSDVNVTPSATLGPKGFAGDASTHIKVTTNATTTGGGIGSNLRFVCVTATLWSVQGVIRSPSGTIATPFST